MGKLSRNKGNRFEREIAIRFRGVFGDRVKRGWQAKEGSDAPDIENVPGWWIEAKHHHKSNERKALEQADVARGGADVVPLAVCKDDGKKPVATLYLDDFINMLVRLRDLESAVRTQEKLASETKIAG